MNPLEPDRFDIVTEIRREALHFSLGAVIAEITGDLATSGGGQVQVAIEDPDHRLYQVIVDRDLVPEASDVDMERIEQRWLS